MGKPIIAIKTSARNYSGLVALGNAIHDGLTGNLAYTNPLPAVNLLQSQIDSVTQNIALWGPPNNRGSRTDLQNLRVSAIVLRQTIISLSQYVMNTAQTAEGSDYEAMAAMIRTSGFGLKGESNPQGRLEKVQDLQTVVSRSLNQNQVKLEWKKPLNVTSRNNVKSYKIYKGVTPPVLSTCAYYATVTKSNFVDSNLSGSQQTWAYFVIAVNGFGDGATSDPLVAIVPGV